MKRLLFILAALLLVSMASAQFTNDLSAYYAFESGALTTDETGNITLNSLGSPTSNATGKDGGGVTLDGSSYMAESVTRGVGDLTVSFWYIASFTTSGQWYGWWGNQGSGYTGGIRTPIYYQNSAVQQPLVNFHDGGTSVQIYCDGSDCASFNDLETDWHHVVVAHDHSADRIALYIDGVLQANKSGSVFHSANDDNLAFGSYQGANFSSYVNAFEGTIDEAAIWDLYLSPSNVTDLYNSGTGCFYGDACFGGAAPASPPTISLQLPTDNDHSADQPMTFQFSANTTADTTMNCSIYLDTGGGFFIPQNGTITGVANSTSHQINITLNETSNDWFASCTDNNGNTNSTNWTVVADYTYPDWAFLSANLFETDNTTVLYPVRDGSEYYPWNFTLADTYVFGYNVSFFNNTDDYINATQSGNTSIQETNLSGTLYNFTYWWNSTYYPTATGYYANLTGSDDHTAKQWRASSITKGLKGLTVDTPEGLTVTVENTAGNLKSITYTESIDRVSYSFTPNNNRKTWTFLLSCTGTLYHRAMWMETLGPTFVCYDAEKKNGNWIDFHSPTTFTNVDVTPSGDDYLITLTKASNNNDAVTFNSIGGLNIQNEVYSWALSRMPRSSQNISSSAIGETYATISWDDHPEGNMTMLMFQNGTGIVNTTAETYNVTGLSVNTTYTFLIEPYYDEFGTLLINDTHDSENNITVITGDGVPPMVEGFNSPSQGEDWIYVNWTIPATVNGTELYRDAVLILNATNNTLFFNDTGRAAGTSYTYRMITYTAAGGYNVTINTNTVSQFSVSTTTNTSLSVTIRNEVNEALITDQVFVNLISTSKNESVNTTTGTVSISNITSDNYTIRHTGIGWGLRDQYAAFTANSTQNTTLYLLNDTYRGTAEIIVVDTRTNPLSDMRVKLLRYYGSCNCYATVEMATTTSDGTAAFSAQLLDAFYRWIIEDSSGSTLLITTTPENLVPEVDGIARKTFTVDTGNNFYTSYINDVEIGRVTTYNNATQTLTFTWNDPSGIVTQGCLQAEYVNGSRWELEGPNCTSAATGSVLLTLAQPPNTTTYHWKSTLTTSTTYSSLIDTGTVETIRSFVLGPMAAVLHVGVIIGGAILFSFSGIAVMLWVSANLLVSMFLSFAGYSILPFGYTAVASFIFLLVGVFSIFLMRR